MITLIAAIGKNGELGKNNELIWHLKEDLIFFKNTTTNHKIVMGYNTYKSIGKPLPNRKNIVLTHHKLIVNNLIVYDNIDELINKEISKNEECFIIGGATLYKSFYNMADKMYITHIDDECKTADAYFPTINKKDWKKKILNRKKTDNIKYQFVLYERIKNE